jgi:pyrrolidone-carboxylate peptidase
VSTDVSPHAARSLLTRGGRGFSAFAAFVTFAALSSCDAVEPENGSDAVGATETTEDAIRLRTMSPEARAQYDANVAFALGYRPLCTASPPAGTARRPRVLVTGFGRFMTHTQNATGLMVTRLVPGMTYPVTARPPAGQVDPPEPQTAVGSATVELDGVGPVDVCAMVLPVYWDLAAILALKEIQSFAPDVVLMNGIAGRRQALWLELGSVNRALALQDGSEALVPLAPEGQRFAPIVPSASAAELSMGLRFSYGPVQQAASAAIAARGEVLEAGARFDRVAQGVLRGGFPRHGNTYLCNNTTYVVNHAMARPGAALTLLQASPALANRVNRVTVRLTRDVRAVPRVFIHWPSDLAGVHLDAGTEVMKAILSAQLRALREGGASLPVVGDNRDAEIAPTGGWY